MPLFATRRIAPLIRRRVSARRSRGRAPRDGAGEHFGKLVLRVADVQRGVDDDPPQPAVRARQHAQMLEKALGPTPDALVPDLEDSVPEAQKAQRARRSAIPAAARGERVLVIPRVNSLDTVWFEEDLAAVVGPHIDGDFDRQNPQRSRHQPRLEPYRRSRVARRTAARPREAHPVDRDRRGDRERDSICRASARLVGVAFGGEDFTHDLGIERLDDDSHLALCARGSAPRAPRRARARHALLQAP